MVECNLERISVIFVTIQPPVYITDNSNTKDLSLLTLKRHSASVEKGSKNKSKISKHTFVNKEIK